MTSESGSRADGRAFVSIVVAALIVTATLFVAGCSAPTSSRPPGAAGGPGPGRPQPLPTLSVSPDPFDQADQAMKRMVGAKASWHAPTRLVVDQPSDIGLSIGDTEELRQQIQQNLPRTTAMGAGTLKVGTDMRATLEVDPQLAVIEPTDAIDASTGSQVGLLWTWKVHPLESTTLSLTAHLEMLVPGTTHVLTHDVPLTLRVDGTAGHLVGRVFANWGTWAAIVAAAAGSLRWLWLRLPFRTATGTALSRGVPRGRGSGG